MSTVSEIENAVETLSMADKYELLRFLMGQLRPKADTETVVNEHSVLDIPPVQLGPLLRSWNEDGDRLEEMLEGALMNCGLDTGFLVAAEVVEHPWNVAARAKLAALVANGDQFALAPQVLAEFIHVVTDGRRFSNPLSLGVAIDIAERWWTAREVKPIFPGEQAGRRFFSWMRIHALGRKRLLDTLLAATFEEAGLTHILTTNSADFVIFGCFHCELP